MDEEDDFDVLDVVAARSRGLTDAEVQKWEAYELVAAAAQRREEAQVRRTSKEEPKEEDGEFIMNVIRERQALSSQPEALSSQRPAKPSDNQDDHRPEETSMLPGAYAAAPGTELQRRVLVTTSHGKSSSGGSEESSAAVDCSAACEIDGNEASVSGNDGGDLLVVANPVDDTIPNNGIIPVAQDYNNAENNNNRYVQGEESIRQQKTRILVGAIGLAAVIMIVFAVVLLSLTAGKQSAAEEEGDHALLDPNIDDSSTFSPSLVPPSLPPSAAPSQALSAFLEQLPAFTHSTLHNVTSPQGLAFNWLQDYPNVTSLEDWRITQLFALATFFYAFEGPRWRQE
ncbi:expressed unknown protein [Seminavis robusta]|uniref:Uncharacterized protein n=1 Tax=Seminavis robusta TaxID=568900 RepID=A0A9N8DXP6_9STRA|nr:expressed unknown protein [Seminavis robusta]|eukprot:Sro449_g145270.1 n/a (342) ;mRNA; f:17578-18603